MENEKFRKMFIVAYLVSLSIKGRNIFGTFVTIAKLPDKTPVHGLLKMIYASIEKITGL